MPVLTVNSSFFIFSKNCKFLKMFCKNLCNKVLKMKNLRWPSSLFFHPLHCGVLWFFCPCIFPGENRETKSLVLTFLKKAEKGKFVSQFSPWKMHRQKKQSTPQRRTRKNEEDGSLRFFIFETLSQRFLQNIFRDFQFFDSTPLPECWGNGLLYARSP